MADLETIKNDIMEHVDDILTPEVKAAATAEGKGSVAPAQQPGQE